MAKSLNKKRMQQSRILVIAVLAIVLFSRTLIPYETVWHENIDFIGYFLLAVCALGRLYSTAFLGGHKNQNLITYGVYSIVRNPLYFFSLLGMTGIALLSGHITIMIIIPIFFVILYHFLIKREEEFLLKTFGQDFQNYMNKTPRLIPNLKLYNAPDVIETVPKYLNKGFKDAIWWFAAFPLVEFAEFLQESGLIQPFILIP